MSEQSFNVGDRVRAIDAGPIDAMIFVAVGTEGVVAQSHPNKYDGFPEVYAVDFDDAGVTYTQLCIPSVIEKIESP